MIREGETLKMISFRSTIANQFTISTIRFKNKHRKIYVIVILQIYFYLN